MPIFQKIEGGGGNHFFIASTQWGLGKIGLGYSLENLICILAGVMVGKYALLSVSRYLGRILNARITADLREKAFGNLIALPLSWFYNQKTGDLVGAQFTSVYHAGFIFEYGVLVINSIVFCLLYLVLSLAISFWLTALVLTFTGASWFFLWRRFQKSYLGGEKEAQAMEHIHSYLHDVFSGIKTVKILGNFMRRREHYKRLVGNYREGFTSLIYNRIFISWFDEPLIFLLIVLCLFVATVLLGFSFTKITVFLAIFLQVLPKLKILNTHLVTINEYLPHLSNVLEYTKNQRQEDAYPPEDSASINILKWGVRFENVSFAYSGSTFNALNEISASIEKGGTTALVGASGGGKTTFVDLFLRLHEPTRGVIYVDGVDLRDVSAHEWRSRIGVVEQDPYLFNDTVLSNIRYGNQEADEREVRSAAETAYAHDFIKELPEGYQTIIGNRGFKLSGGQKQRLALARALVRSPEILVLDEATSALDSEFERLIQIAVQRLSGRVTILAVAHRLSTIKNADKILVLENGRIIQEGSHDSLMRKEGQYRKLVELQS